jgi:hypothetical protein
MEIAHTRFYRKGPGLCRERNSGLTYSILAAISFKIISMGTYITIHVPKKKKKKKTNGMFFVELRT